jgi:hypothetical protein
MGEAKHKEYKAPFIPYTGAAMLAYLGSSFLFFTGHVSEVSQAKGPNEGESSTPIKPE